MINVLCYLGMSLQAEVCLWTLLGILTTVFDATLFKVNSNLKQVWQMRMPEELSTAVQRSVRALISGLMLAQCFTVYVYLAAYIVLLYPVFLEERPTLVLPWLLLAAFRKLLCELTSLALGLGICVLLGASRPPCIKFVVMKIFSITPAFYMWLLVLNYYHGLKLATSYKTFRTSPLSTSEHEYGLELAVRRRRTKSLQGEETLRRKLLANLYSEGLPFENNKLGQFNKQTMDYSNKDLHEDVGPHIIEVVQSFNTPKRTISNRMLSDIDVGLTIDVTVPRDTDRILEQLVWMLLKIGVLKKREGIIPTEVQPMPVISTSTSQNIGYDSVSDFPVHTVESVRGGTMSYIKDYPQIFMKKAPDTKFNFPPSRELISTSTQTDIQGDDDGNFKMTERKVSVSISPDKIITTVETERKISVKTSSKNLNKTIQTNKKNTTKEESIKISSESSLSDEDGGKKNTNSKKTEN